MLITDVVDLDDVEREIVAKYVTRRLHPDFPDLAILNYSDACQFDKHWTETTRQTRGLIYNMETLELIARPFGKMYNFGDEEQTGQLDLDARIEGAFDKWDGSLGIEYKRPDGKWAIATRGSFDSEQARHANLTPRQGIENGHTRIFEIIYPGNRIVVNYGDRDELIYLGSVENETGAFFASDEWRLPAETLREALALPNRENAEGMVVWISDWTAVKIKQDDYLALHRIVSSLSEKEVWRQLRAGTYRQFAEALPDEFYIWSQDIRDHLIFEFGQIEMLAGDSYVDIIQWSDDRKSQALRIMETIAPQYRGLVFGLLDGKDITDSIWRMLEPRGVAAS